jgi:sulfide dehydrogenase cytochrome subunit
MRQLPQIGMLIFVFAVGTNSASASDAIIKDCVACHGPAGISSDAEVPRIGGMSSYYLGSSMETYAKGERACPEVSYPQAAQAGSGKTTMCKIAKALNEADIAKVANYFAAHPFVPATGQKTDAALVSRGQKLHDRHCQKCHTENGSYPDDDAGVMAGQWMSYLRLSFQDLRTGKRYGGDKMKEKLDALSSEDVEALVHFYASQK